MLNLRTLLPPRNRGRRFGGWLTGLLLATGLLVGPRLVWASDATCAADTVVFVTFSASCTASANCTFTLLTPTSGIASVSWDYGDGTSDGYGAHHYLPGYYEVTASVTDGNGNVLVGQEALAVASDASQLAMDDTFTTPRNEPITITTDELLANDVPGVLFLTASVSFSGNSFTYTPPATGGGTTFQYWVKDADSSQNASAFVHINVTEALQANPDFLTTGCNKALDVFSSQLLQNDTPPTAAFIRAENPVHGALSLIGVTAQGTQYRFTPDVQFFGAGSFEYLISADGNQPYERGFVTVDVVPDAPVAQFTVMCTNLSCTVRPTSTSCIGPLRYFWTWGDGTPEFEVTTPPYPYGWVDQTHTYPASGRFTITHRVVDVAGQSGSLQLDVVPNLVPTAQNDTFTTDRDVPALIDVLANDINPNNSPLTIYNVDVQTLYPGASYGFVGSKLKVTPPDTFVGTMIFHYSISNGWGGSSTATVTLVVNQWTYIVDALGEQFYCPANQSIQIYLSTLLSNDYDDNPDPVQRQLSIVSMDTSFIMGTLVCNATYCTYTPPNNANGFTMFRYTASDSTGHHDTATVKIFVGLARGGPPVVQNVYFTTTRNTPKVFWLQDIALNDPDPDGDALTVTLASGAREFGSLTCSSPFYKCTYTPNTGFIGTDSFTYTATDTLFPSAYAYINMLVLPPSPLVFDLRDRAYSALITNQSYFSYSGLTNGAYTPNGGPVTVTSVDTTGLTGTLTCDTFGCSYLPPVGWQGVTRFKFTANDGHGATDTAFVKLRVGTTPNHAPKAGPMTLQAHKNTPLTFTVYELLRGASDEDNDPMSPSISTTGTRLGTVSCGSYLCTYTPYANVTGSEVFTYSVSDGLLTSAAAPTATVTFNIAPQ